MTVDEAILAMQAVLETVLEEEPANSEAKKALALLERVRDIMAMLDTLALSLEGLA